MLVDATSGVPVFDATVWAISQYRRRSASTMEQALRGAIVLHLICRYQNIDLEQRLRTGAFLQLFEIETLVALVKRPSAQLAALAPLNEAQARVATGTSVANVSHFGKFLRRLPSARQRSSLANQTVIIRLHYIASYLKWLGSREQGRLKRSVSARDLIWSGEESYAEGVKEMVQAILARQPKGNGRGRLALTPAQREELLKVIIPGNPENPWQDSFIQCRNQLMLHWLLGTGMRRGEMLAIRVRNVRFGTACVEIRRTQDDKRDVRRRQPLAKGAERLAPLDADSLDLTQQYVVDRGRIEAARRHSFLFVAANGAPLSISSLEAVFATLRRVHPQIGKVCAHVLRHTWNEEFTVFARESGMNSQEEADVRRELMGWSISSNMPTVYGRRATAKAAGQASILMQQRLLRLKDTGRGKDD